MTYFTYYSYDARNQLSALTSPLAETVYYQYDALGREIARRLPNTATTYHNYDAASQVTSLIHRGSSSVLQSLYYTYDADGQRTKIEREDNTRIYYSYDASHRLTGEDWLDPSNVHLYAFAYQYDAAGNRLKQTCNNATTYYSYNNLNELTTERVLGGAATYYTWTADGEMATKHDTAGWTYYTWDVDESLKTIQTPSVTLESKYNSRMQRVWRSENGTAEKLIYDAQKLIAEATGTGTALNRYYLSEGGSVYSPLLAQLGSEHWFLFDALGTTLGRTGTTATPYQYVGGYGYFNEPNVGLEQARRLLQSKQLNGAAQVAAAYAALQAGDTDLARSFLRYDSRSILTKEGSLLLAILAAEQRAYGQSLVQYVATSLRLREQEPSDGDAPHHPYSDLWEPAAPTSSEMWRLLQKTASAGGDDLYARTLVGIALIEQGEPQQARGTLAAVSRQHPGAEPATLYLQDGSLSRWDPRRDNAAIVATFRRDSYEAILSPRWQPR